MSFKFTAKKLLVVGAVGLAACTTASPPTSNTNTANRTATNSAAPVSTAPANTATPAAASNIPHPEIKRISPQESQALVAKNEAVIVDVRDASTYQSGHVKGALHITTADLQARLKELPRDKKVITYCS